MPFPSMLSNDARATLKRHLLREPGAHKALLDLFNAGRLKASRPAISVLAKTDLELLCDVLKVDAERIIADAEQFIANALQNNPPATQQEDAQNVQKDIEAFEAIEAIEALEDAMDVEAADALDRLASQVLAPIAPFAAPAMIRDMSDRLGALVLTARDQIAEASRQASVTASRPVAASASRRGKVTLGKAFKLKGSGGWYDLPVSMWTPTAMTPAIDPDYVLDVEILGLVMSQIERGLGAWVWGPKGVGKTELMRQVAAYTGRPFVRMGFADDMDKYAMIGQRLPDASGAFTYRDGILTQAIRMSGALICYDEPSLAKPNLLGMLQTSLDIRSLSIEETGEVVPFADGVGFCACDNTDGYGDSTGHYAGTGALNEGFLDRFPRKFEMSTPTAGMLERIIVKRTGLARDASAMLAGVIKTSESMWTKGELSTFLSLRPVLCFARDLKDGLPTRACFDSTILSAMPKAEAQALRQWSNAHLDLQALERLARGISAPPVMPVAAPLPDATISAARNEFADR